jgi:arylsulfatase A-like enzyme
MAMASRPNILLVTSDQQHFSTLGVTNPTIKTPALDRLAREGVRFDRSYCVNPTCSPARASLLTGLYPSAHHCWTIGVKLPEDVPTLGEHLRAGGYRSVLVGKAHFQPVYSAPGSDSLECMPVMRNLDFWRGFHGPWYGFDRVETSRVHGGQATVGSHYAAWMEDNGLPEWRDYFTPWPEERSREEQYQPRLTGDGWIVPGTYGETEWLADRQAGLEEEKQRPSTHEGPAWKIPEEFHHSTWVAERSMAQIDACVGAGEPFFLWASFYDPHRPYAIPDPWATMYDPEEMEPGTFVEGEFDDMPPHHQRTREEKPDWSDYEEPGGRMLHGCSSHLHRREAMQKSMAKYYGMVSFLDHQLGRILDHLDRLGIAENTLIVFTTDHGEFLGQHGLTDKGPFHYEDMIRTPMLARWPGELPAGAVSEALQSQVDYAPTFLAAAGLAIPGLMQGVNQLPAWRGGEAVRRHVLCENRHNPTKMHLRTLVNERYKLTVYRNRPYGELFDLQEDPEERRNLWNDPAAAEVKAQLLLELAHAEIEREPTRMPRLSGA